MACPRPKDTLDIKNITEVEELLTKHNFTTVHYYELGLHLGLSTDTLDTIEANHNKNAFRCLIECLKAWLRQADQVKKRGGPTHHALIKALKEIGEVAAAEGIDKEVHPACCILQKYLSQQSIVDVLPQCAIFLYTEGVVCKMLVTKEELKSAVQNSVCAAGSNLDKFIAILQKIPSTASITRSHYITGGEQSSKPSPMDNDKEITVKMSSVELGEFKFMRSKFASAAFDACKAMSDIPPNELKKYLRCGYRYLAPQLESMCTTDDMLELVCDQCSLVDLCLLESVANHFKNEKAMTCIEEYMKYVQDFKSLRSFIDKDLSSDSALESEKITIIVDRNVDDCTINDVKLLLTHAFKDLAPHVKISVIKEHHSFIVTCSFPLALSEQLIATAEGNIELLKEKGVTKLTIGYYTMHNSGEVTNDKGEQEPEAISSMDHNDNKFKQLMLSQSVQLHNTREEIQKLETQIQELLSDKDLIDYSSLKKKCDKLLKEKEDLNQKVAQLQKQVQKPLPREQNPIIFEDDVYGDIVIDHPLIVKIIKTRQFQRLKDIKQLGYIYQNIPKATYSRLQNSIGMYYLAGKYVKQLQRQTELSITESDVLCIQVAALCYNLGYGPFSHTFDMFLEEIFKGRKPWEDVSEASVEMFEHMIEDNNELMPEFKKYLDNPEEDISFIKELVKGEKTGKRKDKKFLYEIVLNESSGLDVCMLDYTARNATVLGKKVNFKWRVFLTKVRVSECDGELHICVQKDDLDTYNDLFSTRHSIYRELYYLRKNRVVTVMIKRILVKTSDKLVRERRNSQKMVSISEATQSMSAFTQLTDGILNLIKSLVDDPEVQMLLDCLNTLKLIAQIGFITPKDGWNTEDLKKHIIKAMNKATEDITDYLIIDPIKTGYEEHQVQEQYYYCRDYSTGKWKSDWAKPPPQAQVKPPWRVFLVSGNWNTIESVQLALKGIIAKEKVYGEIYPKQENDDLMTDFQTTGASLVSQKIL